MNQVSDAVNSLTGLSFPRERWPELARGIESTAHDLGFKDTLSCIHSLLSSQLNKEQFDILLKHLIRGDTFFFNDPTVFQVLEDHILSRWIRSRHSAERCIHIWSAGCGSGEEPYSIAMLVDQMIPPFQEWKITILATEMDPFFLQKAKEGIYSQWSFRDTPEGILEKYFRKIDEDRFEISSSLKEMVHFYQLNLTDIDHPSLIDSTWNMDLIFCRNILSNYSQDVRAEAVILLSNCLKKGGWLIVGPSEAGLIEYPGLNPVHFPGAIFHRKGLPRKGDKLKEDVNSFMNTP